MEPNVEKLEQDLDLALKRWQHDWDLKDKQRSWEIKKFIVQCLAAAIALFATGIAAANDFHLYK